MAQKSAEKSGNSCSSNGFEAYRLAKERGFEEIVAKDDAAPYMEGRSKSWLKVKVHEEEEFVIGGFSQPGGSRQHLGALLLGAYDKKRFDMWERSEPGSHALHLPPFHAS